MTIKTKDQTALPAQPANRYKLLEVIRDQLKTGDGKTGINILIQSGEAVDAMGEVLQDQELQTAIFKHVKDGDERAIIRRFFANLDE
jgi:hypothetical protein